MVSSGDIPHKGVGVQKGAKKERGAGLVGEALVSVGVGASRRAVSPRGKVAAGSVLSVLTVVLEGEVILGSARQGESGSTQ